MRFAIEELIPTLSQHGVDCVETFCSLTESNFKEIGLNIGEIKKCNLAAQHMKDKIVCFPNQTDEVDRETDNEWLSKKCIDWKVIETIAVDRIFAQKRWLNLHQMIMVWVSTVGKQLKQEYKL